MDNKPVIIRLKKRPTIVKPKPPAIRISKRKAAVSIQIAPTQALQRFKTWVHKARLDEKPHQIEGMQWCLSHELLPMTGLARRRGGIVADEMGLGKTILMLGCIVSNFRRRTLIILPPALLSQWVKVIQDRLGHRPLVYHGAKIRKTSDEELQAAPVVVTTYGMIAARQPSKGAAWISPLWKVRWDRIIYDEAHHMRNMETATFQGAKKLRSSISWLVTGTPIQNKKADLYALCSMLGLDVTTFGNPAALRRIVHTHILRRTKQQVGIKLPPIRTHQIDIPWKSAPEEKLAADIHSLSTFSAVTSANVTELIQFLGRHHLPVLTRARQCCILPQLIHRALAKMRPNLLREGIICEGTRLPTVRTFSKVLSVVETIAARRGNGRRKLVFCWYRGEIDAVAALLRRLQIAVRRIDGRVSRKQRKLEMAPSVSQAQWNSVCKGWHQNAVIHSLVEDFLAPEVLVVQIQTASEGLNLQQFKEIYFTSPHWNPAVEDQAVARSHRIGQTSPVDVFRFVMQGFDDRALSIDQYSQLVQDKKREIMKLVN